VWSRTATADAISIDPSHADYGHQGLITELKPMWKSSISILLEFCHTSYIEAICMQDIEGGSWDVLGILRTAWRAVWVGTTREDPGMS